MEKEIFENSPEYFKNKFSNNCKMRLRYISKLKNCFFNANNIVDQYMELEKQKDPYWSDMNSFKDIYITIKSIYENELNELEQQIQEELNNELEKDFSKILNNNKEKLKKD